MCECDLIRHKGKIVVYCKNNCLICNNFNLLEKGTICPLAMSSG